YDCFAGKRGNIKREGIFLVGFDFLDDESSQDIQPSFKILRVGYPVVSCNEELNDFRFGTQGGRAYTFAVDRYHAKAKEIHLSIHGGISDNRSAYRVEFWLLR